MVKSILQRLDSNGEGEKEASSIGTIKSQLSTLSAFTPPSAELDLNPDMQVHAPVLSLFDNALVRLPKYLQVFQSSLLRYIVYSEG